MESQQRVRRAVENRKKEESCGSGKKVVEGREDTWQEEKPVLQKSDLWSGCLLRCLGI
jgi:hypothetical protein